MDKVKSAVRSEIEGLRWQQEIHGNMKESLAAARLRHEYTS